MARLSPNSTTYGTSPGSTTKTDLTYIDGRPTIKKMTRSGHNNILILTYDGRVYSAGGEGSNSASGHGRGLVNEDSVRGLFMLQPVPFVFANGSEKVVDIGGNGYSINWALTNFSNLYTWGYNSYGVCGLGHTNQVPHPTLVMYNVNKVFDQWDDGYEVGRASMAVLSHDGYVYVWGENQDGELGLGNTTAQYTTPQKATALGTGVVTLLNHGGYAGWMLAQKSDNTLWYAGWNGSYQAGTGSTANLTTWTNISANWGTCATGQIKSWAAAGSYFDSAVNNTHSIHIVSWNGEYWNCGANNWGQLGTGNTSTKTTPSRCTTGDLGTNSVHSVQCMGGGPATVSVIGTNSKVYQHGYSSYGQVSGVQGNQLTPKYVYTSRSAYSHGREENRHIGENSSMGVFTNRQNAHTYGYRTQQYYKDFMGVLWAHGYNSGGYLGAGRNYTAEVQTTPVQVLMPNWAEEVYDMAFFTTTSHGRISVALTNDHRLFAWAYNDHQGILYPNYGRVYTPIEVPMPH